MKLALRRLSLLAPLALCVLLVGCGQKYNVSPDPADRFKKAAELEKSAPVAAMEEYSKISTEYSNSNAQTTADIAKYREIAAQALVKAAQFGYAYADPANLNDATLSPAAKSEREQIQNQVGDAANQDSKTLDEKFRDTAAGSAALGMNTPNAPNLRELVKNRIDARNSHLVGYKIISGIVRATGANPQFSYWFALLLIAVFVKAVTMPITLRMYKSQREMQRIQPILKKLQDDYKDKTPQERNEAVMAAYKEHGVNPFASCLPSIIQLPFLWAVYGMIRQYEFHFSNGHFLWINPALNHQFPAFIAGNMGQFDVPLLVLYALSNYFTMRLMPPSDPQAAEQQKVMSVTMTFVLLFMFLQYKWSAAFMFYWLILNFISAWQQYTYIYKPNKMRLSQAISFTGDNTTTAPETSGGKTSGNGSKPQSNGAKPARPATPAPETGTNTNRPRPRRKNGPRK